MIASTTRYLCRAGREAAAKYLKQESGEFFTKGVNNTVRDLMKPKSGQISLPSTNAVEVTPSVNALLIQATPMGRSLAQQAEGQLRTRSRTMSFTQGAFERTFSRNYSTLFSPSGGEGGGTPGLPPPAPRQGRLDALKFLQESYPAPSQGAQILLGHIVKRGIEQFASSVPGLMQDMASGSIGKHYREDVGGLLKMPGSDQNRALLACVETVQWNQEGQKSGNILGASMTAADRFAILTSGQNLNNPAPTFSQGLQAVFSGSWEPISKTASLTDEQRKIFDSVSNEVMEMAASLSKDGEVNIKQLGAAVTKCAEQSENDPKKLLNLLKEKNEALKAEHPDKNVSLERAKDLQLKNGNSLGSAIGKPKVPQGPSLGVRM